MPGARRDALSGADGGRAEHAGLLLASYLESQDESAKRALFDQAVRACGRARPVYEMAFERWRQSLPAGTVFQRVVTQGRFVTGLGMASALETGIRLHHTYGTPLIPGSGLKGLCAHYCDNAWGAQREEFRADGAAHRVLFGDTAEAGMIVFHDAWMLPGELGGSLVADVMTPHHLKYGGRGSAAPSDFDSPTTTQIFEVPISNPAMILSLPISISDR